MFPSIEKQGVLRVWFNTNNHGVTTKEYVSLCIIKAINNTKS